MTQNGGKVYRTRVHKGLRRMHEGEQMPTSEAPPTGLLTVSEAAAQLGVSPWEVVRLTESGRLPCVVYVPAQAVREFQETQ